MIGENKIYLSILDFFYVIIFENFDRFPAERNQQDNKVSNSVAWAFLKLSRL